MNATAKQNQKLKAVGPGRDAGHLSIPPAACTTTICQVLANGQVAITNIYNDGQYDPSKPHTVLAKIVIDREHARSLAAALFNLVPTEDVKH